jgi:transcriptional regulator with XRE-family HTH domain
VDARERLARNIRDQRKRRGMSQEELAFACDLHPTEISRLERSARDPRFSTIVRVARALKVKPAELLDGIR